MNNVTLEGVQRLLRLDVDYPSFPTWVEVLQFEVDGGVLVKAVATHSWRRETVKVIEPFEIEGSAYHQGYEPPFFALGFSMLKHRESLEKRGMTLTDESIRMATITYQRHRAYLLSKLIIDAEQKRFLERFQDELGSFEAADAKVQSRIAGEKRLLRKKFKADQIRQKDYQSGLKKLAKEAWESSLPHSELKQKIQRGLEEIKNSVIDQVLFQGHEKH